MGFGAILSAVSPVVGSLAGALINKRSNDKQHQYQTHVEQRNIARDYDFAKNQLQWRAEDARKAGIHPLAAMGGQTYTPSANIAGGGGMADVGGNLAQMGQDIGRAIKAGQDKYTRQVQEITLENLKTDSAMKKLQLQQAMKSANQQIAPAVPNPVKEQTNPSGKIRKVNSDVMSSIGRGAVQAGQPPAYRWVKTGKEEYQPVLSEQMKQSEEETPGAFTSWIEMRFKAGKLDKPFKAPTGKYWDYNAATGKLVLKKGRKPDSMEQILKKARKGKYFNHKFGPIYKRLYIK